MNTAKRSLYLGMLKVFNLGLMIAAFGIVTVLLVPKEDGGVPLTDFLSVRVKLINFLTFCLVLLGMAQHLLFLRTVSIAASGALILGYCKCYLCHHNRVAFSRSSGNRISDPHGYARVFPAILDSCFGVSGRMRVLIQYVVLAACGRAAVTFRYILILGTNRRAVEFARRLDARPEWGYRLLDSWTGNGIDVNLAKPYPLCCRFDSLAGYLRRNVVDEVGELSAFAVFLRTRLWHRNAM